MMSATKLAGAVVVLLIGSVATPVAAQWRVSTDGGLPMAQNIGGDGLGVGVICENGRQSVMVMLPGEDLASRSVVARWSDGTENEYNFRLTSDGYLMGTTATVNFRQMITKLRRLNSVTLTVDRSGDRTLTDTISLAGSSRAIGRISCGGPREPRRASRRATTQRPGRPAATQRQADEAEVTAMVYCPDEVERLARYGSRWVDGWLEPKFSRYRWKDRTGGIVTYLGDKLELQNGFGAWVPHVYECDIDVWTDNVTEVRARPGRLP